MMRTALFSAAYAAMLPMLANCGIVPIDVHQPPEADFPELVVVTHVVPQQVMLEQCAATNRTGPLACASVDLDTLMCTIWYSADVPPTSEIVEHEQLHCKGYDHVGESTIRDLWQKFKQKKTP